MCSDIFQTMEGFIQTMTNNSRQKKANRQKIGIFLYKLIFVATEVLNSLNLREMLQKGGRKCLYFI